MKKTSLFLTAAAFAAACLSLSSCTIKQEAPVQRTITVTGTASVETEIDQIHLSISIETRNKDITKASSENAERMTNVMNALKENGINEKDISTSNYNIYEDRYSNNKTTEYVVHNTINILFYDTAKTGDIIDIAVKNGANNISSLNFTSSKANEGKKQARLLAIKNADEKANLMAAASGLSVGKALNIVEGSVNSNASVNEYKLLAVSRASGDYDTSTPISAGQAEVTSSVTITYEMY